MELCAIVATVRSRLASNMAAFAATSLVEKEKDGVLEYYCSNVSRGNLFGISHSITLVSVLPQN